MVSGRRLIHLLELARIELLLAAISNVWLMTFLALAVEGPEQRNPALDQLGPGWALLLVTLVALGLTGCGMALNDVLDARHDRAFAPGRPIPSGRINIAAAVAAAMLGLLIGLAGAVPLGKLSAVMALLAAGGMLFYNLAGRFVPAVGIVSLGLITAVSMLVPNPRPVFVWPIVLTMSHVMACAGLRHWLAGKRPRLRAVDGWGLCIGWAFWTLLLIGVMSTQGHVWTEAGGGLPGARLLWAGPMLAVAGFVIASWMVLHAKMGPVRSRRAVGRRFARMCALWLIIYDASWLFSAGLYWQGGIILGLFLAACFLSRSRPAPGGTNHVEAAQRPPIT